MSVRIQNFKNVFIYSFEAVLEEIYLDYIIFNSFYCILRQITNLNKHWYFLTTMLLFFLTALGRLRKITALPLSITQSIMDEFWCSRCLNDCIEVPEMMGSFPGGSITPLVVKSGTKQTWWKVGFFLVQYMPHENCSTAIISHHIWKWLTVYGSMNPCQQLSHTKFWFQLLS